MTLILLILNILSGELMPDLEYCYEHCAKGKLASDNFLKRCNSAYDAVSDFYNFATECFETCPYKDKATSTEELSMGGSKLF